jgi:hypothetical protein
MIDPDLDDLVDAVTDIDLGPGPLDDVRHGRPRLYYGVVIGIVVVLAVLVYVLLW